MKVDKAERFFSLPNPAFLQNNAKRQLMEVDDWSAV